MHTFEYLKPHTYKEGNSITRIEAVPLVSEDGYRVREFISN